MLITSDLHGHFDKWLPYYNDNSSDIHLITGDICTNERQPQERKLLLWLEERCTQKVDAMGNITQLSPIYITRGNHDVRLKFMRKKWRRTGLWTEEEIVKISDFLKNLPPVIKIGKYYFAHGYIDKTIYEHTDKEYREKVIYDMSPIMLDCKIGCFYHRTRPCTFNCSYPNEECGMHCSKMFKQKSLRAWLSYVPSYKEYCEQLERDNMIAVNGHFYTSIYHEGRHTHGWREQENAANKVYISPNGAHIVVDSELGDPKAEITPLYLDITPTIKGGD